MNMSLSSPEGICLQCTDFRELCGFKHKVLCVSSGVESTTPLLFTESIINSAEFINKIAGLAGDV